MIVSYEAFVKGAMSGRGGLQFSPGTILLEKRLTAIATLALSPLQQLYQTRNMMREAEHGVRTGCFY